MRLLVLATLLLPAAATAAVTAGNVATLVPRWTVEGGGGVSGGPIVRDGRVYVGAWNRRVFALDAATGAQLWSHEAIGAVPGRVLALDDGGICYGTIEPTGGEVGCLDGATGAVRWRRHVGDPLDGVVWSGPVAANGRLFVGVAGLADDPCSRGRLLALDLATGNELWRFYTIPEKVCSTDTAVACALDADCPDAGTCVIGRGGGVTATPSVDPTGEWVYMNTVGCYTYPSIGESDSIFKIAASDGTVAWRRRVSAPEQFGACANDPGIDCGVDAHCAGVGGTCNEKSFYHDFGFVNGPLRIEVPDGLGGMKPLIVSGSKNGTLYALDEATGDVAWTNVVRSEPVTPGFAGYGLFNGAIAHADGRLFAALYYMFPPRVCSNDPTQGCSSDANCPGGTCPPEPKHLMAFDATTGATAWAEEIGRSWSHVGVANGVVYAGTQDTDGDTDASWLYAHDASTGARLATFPLPRNSAARAAVVGDTVYVGFGIGGGGGVTALSLCGNDTIDDGEACDAGIAGNGCCTAACTLAPAGTACDDGDACTAGDQCDAASCAGTVTTLDQLGCKLDAFTDTPCGDATLPKSLTRAIDRAIARVERLFAKAASLAASGKTDRAERLRQKAMKALQSIATKAEKAATARKASKRIPADCEAALEALVTSRSAVLESFAF
jgi:polyvinyl alcohol dehydrogenase (cytochrome)